MEKYLNKGIKEVISEFPQVGKLLEDRGIGCVTCSVGTCLLKDIIDVHNLSKAQEAEIMAKIEKSIYPEKDVRIPQESSFTETAAKPLKYSPPIRELVNEHVIIKSFLALVPDLCKRLEEERDLDKELILGIVDFIRNYADKFHHAKEEDILFKYTDEGQDIIKVMYEDHKTGRNYVKAILEGLNTQDVGQITRNLNAYKELLTQHIKKEDEILYPWFDRALSTRQVGELLTRFSQVNDTYTADFYEKYENFIENIKRRLKLAAF